MSLITQKINGNYFDNLYGQTSLLSIIFDFIKKCPELQRLKYVGLMNFKSVHMLGLSNISRLEHSIGMAYLSQLFSEVNHLNIKLRNELIIACLYHDVNCGPFGHSIEWALNRFNTFNHELRSDWILSTSSLTELNKKPIFFDPPGLWRFKLPQKYKVNIENIKNLIQGGNELFFINNSGVDLDNIDNVYRMAHSLGFPNSGKKAIKLVNSLFFKRGFNDFVIKKNKISLLKEWHKLRSSIYNFFIYSDEYMAFEFLLFQLADCMKEYFDYEQIEKMWYETDQGLLTYLRKNIQVAPIVRRLMKGELYNVITILKIRDRDKLIHKKLNDISLVKQICHSLVKTLDLENHGFVSKVLGNLFIHVTTDFRKTNRKIEVFLEDENGIEPYFFGEDKNSTLISILSVKNPPQVFFSLIEDAAVRVVSSILNSDVIIAPINRISSYIEENKKEQKQQPLFNLNDI